MIGIYTITNMVNHKIYVGQSKNIRARLLQHRNRPFRSNDVEYLSPLHQDIRLFCADKSDYYRYFKEDVVCECSLEELNEKEMLYIRRLGTQDPRVGYNIAPGGQIAVVPPAFLSQLIDDLQSTKQSNIELGRKYHLSDQTISDINHGKRWYNPQLQYPLRKREKKEKALIQKRQIPDTEEILEQLEQNKSFASIARHFRVTVRIFRGWLKKLNLPNNRQFYKKPIIKQHAPDFKPILQYDLNNRLVASYESIHEASKALKGDLSARRHIVEVCNKKRKTAYGFIWSYAD